jgi:copper chaperone CopZ
MKYLSLVLLSVVFLSACNQAADSEIGVEKVAVNQDIEADTETKLALDGMVCSMGCVAAIQAKLRETPGVAFASVNYDESFASIKFDSKLVNENDLIAAIGSIGDHSYSAKKYEVAAADMEMEETLEAAEPVTTP